MSQQQAKAREAVKRFMELNQLTILQGEVTAVDATAFTCDVKLPNGLEVFSAMLKTTRKAGKGTVLIPKTGSSVRLLSLGFPDFLVISVEQVDKIYTDAETEIVYNGGENGGIPMIKELKENLEELKKYVEELNKQTSTGFQNVGAGSAANGPGAKTAFDLAMATQSIVFKDMENSKFKH